MPAKIPSEQFLNKRFNKFTIIEDLGFSIRLRKRYVKAVCDCGVLKELPLTMLLTNRVKSCGCRQRIPFVNYVGERFGILVVVEELMRVRRDRCFLVQCDCGNRTYAGYDSLMNGKESCGCLNKAKNGSHFVTHGLTRHPLYSTWCNIKCRCTNPNTDSYKDYGGRGITICEEWKNDFKKFYDWCIESGWQRHLSVDRIDNDGHYEPSNCRITTLEVQSRNKRNNIWIEYQGERLVVTDWCKRLGINETTVYNRIINGMNPVDALTKEVRPNNFHINKIKKISSRS